MTIQEFIQIICDDLWIPVPAISHDTSVFVSDSQLAACSSDGSTIFLANKEASPDLYFSIAHELRHVYQLRADSTRYFSHYRDRSQLSVDEYNMQIAELDANAYAMIIMEDTFGISPLFQGLSDKVKRAIRKRADKIADSI